MTFLEAQQALCRKLDIDYATISANGLFSLDDIKDYIIQGSMQAWDYTFWDFAEHSKTATLLSGDITNGYISYPPDIAPSTCYYLSIGGKKFEKKSFETFTKWFQDYPTNEEKIWAEFKRLLFFNTNSASAGDVVDLYGKRVMPTLSADTDLMIFSPDSDLYEMSGNQAVILLAYAEALSSEKKKNAKQAKVEEEKAFGLLKMLSEQLEQGRSAEQSKNRPMFQVPDYFKGTQGRGQNTIGNFNY
jgi:hypothetical protein